MDISKIESFVKIGPIKISSDKPYLYQNFFRGVRTTNGTTRISWLRLERNGFLPFDVVCEGTQMHVECQDRITNEAQINKLSLPLLLGIRITFDVAR